jgi:rhodanese-related sulfurtransferase
MDLFNAGLRKRNQPMLLTAGLLLLVALVLVGCAGAAAPATAEVTLIGPQQYQQQFNQGQVHALVDVRTPEEFDSGHIPGAVNISVESLATRLDEVPEDKPIVVYCRSGNRSATAADILVENGFQPVYDLGGIQDWIAQGYAVEK